MNKDCYILAEVLFYSGQRKLLPITGYWPDALFAGKSLEAYWGITFSDLSVANFDTRTPAEIRFTFDDIHYSEVQKGQTFQIMEGARQVGEGKILSIERGEQIQNEC